MVIVFIVFSALTVIIIKQYEKTSNNWLLLVTALSETGLIYSYIKLLKNDDILTQFALVKIIAIIKYIYLIFTRFCIFEHQ